MGASLKHRTVIGRAYVPSVPPGSLARQPLERAGVPTVGWKRFLRDAGPHSAREATGAEEALGDYCLSMLRSDDLAACKAESGAFRNEREWVRVIEQPYKDSPSAAVTHGHLKPTCMPVAPNSMIAVTFW